jgi:alkylation response protein AidB-like acyl-CoA dehydrogenase
LEIVMPYRAPVEEFRFLFDHVVGYRHVTATPRFADAADTTEAVLTGAARVCEDVLAPLRRAGDLHPARLENGVVRTTPGFAEAFRAIAEGGWTSVSAPAAWGGLGLPQTLATALNEMMSGANLALQINPLLTQGQIEALAAHASQDLQALYLPKLIAGEWSGTMNLTEPQAGSEVGALRTKAEPNGDGTYAVTGQKIYISWGDADFLPNVVHLVLARLPGAAAGTKGISLFLVPRNLPDADGNPGERNALRVVSLEHKLGLNASPTCVMEYSGAIGWLVGEENGGMAAMFTMMNNARLGVGIQGVGVAEAAFQHALAYAQGRVQGKAPGTGTIVEHADVRRMLAAMKADTQAARAIALSCAVAIDMAEATGDGAWAARAALLTPIAKSFGTDTGTWVANEGVQVHGGMGYVEETGAAQFLRDVRVTAIYEGTNGIQAMDLVGRKMTDGGDAAFRLLDEVQAGAEAARGAEPGMAQSVWNAAELLREATEWLLEQGMEARLAGSVPYQRAFARVLGGHFHLKAALAGDAPRKALARFYVRSLLPEHASLLAQMRDGAETVLALTPGDLAA